MSEAAVQPEVAAPSLESLVAQVVDEFRERLKRGERPDVEEYAARHPQAAELIRKVLASWQLIGLTEAGTRAPTSGAADEPVLGILGDFRLLREVGRGGMGVVYEAEQISLGRRVALKVLPFAATMDARHLQRFQNEARAAAGLHHTNIVPVYYVGSERGVHYYAMQYIEGRDLASAIAQLREQSGCQVYDSRHQATVDVAVGEAVTTSASPAPATKPLAGLSTERSTKAAEHFRAVARLGTQAADALDHAHQMCIVHRDIKPANLLVDDTGRLWVTDFGLAQMQSDTRLTMTGDLVGTLRYMSPEQALAQRIVVDHRTDIYSLGATLYELLTLEPAFNGSDRQELLRQIAFEEPKPPRRINKAIPAELETIVLKAVEKKPQERYATAQELADDLRNWLQDRPVKARRPSYVQRARKWARRHRILVRAVMAVMLTAMLAAGATLWREQAQRDAIERAVAPGLERAQIFQEHERFEEALGILTVVQGQLEVGGPAELRAQVKQRKRDVEMLMRVEAARLQTVAYGRDQNLDHAGADRLYAEAFEWYELDVTTLDPQEAAQRVRGSAVSSRLVAALDDWAFVKDVVNSGSGEAIRRVADLADDDSWRRQLRAATSRQDQAALEALAQAEDALKQPPTNLVLLGRALGYVDRPKQGERLLRQAQAVHPADFWINFELAQFLIKPSTASEAVRFYQAALAIRPWSVAVQLNLGNALRIMGDRAGALAAYRKAIDLEPMFAAAHYNLGLALLETEDLEGAIAESRKAIEIDPKFADPHSTLGHALAIKGDQEGAMAEYHKAIEIDPNYAGAYNNLGLLLRDKGDWSGATAAFRKAVELDPKLAEAHFNLGVALNQMGDVDGAIREWRKATVRDPTMAEAHYNLGSALRMKGDFEGAVPSLRSAINVNPKHVQARGALGLVLLQLGRFAEARKETMHCLVLLKSGESLHQFVSKQLHDCERMVALDDKLTAVLGGSVKTANTAECLALAELCQKPCKKRYLAAFRFFEQAFAAEPKLAGDQPSVARYNAACAAALAGCRQGNDAADLGEEECAKLRRQALEWLRADLAAWGRLLEKEPNKARAPIVQQMRHWQADTDFAGVRGLDALAKLPEAEREEWQKLWQEVEALRQRAAKPPEGASPARP
jgi:serine/threonine protein kinase/Flp pilus assembly protein TadD